MGALGVWALLIPLPLGLLYSGVGERAREVWPAGELWGMALRSFALAGAVAAGAVVLGYGPGRLWGTARTGTVALLLLLLMPLLLPRYVLCYAWRVLLTPTTTLGRAISARPALARFVGTLSSSLVMILWYWPLAALLIGQADRATWPAEPDR